MTGELNIVLPKGLKRGNLRRVDPAETTIRRGSLL